MRRFIMGIVSLIFVGSLAAGCVTTLGHEVDQDSYQQIRKGVTTKAEVIELLGEPNQEKENEDGTSSFVYTFTKVSHGIYGLGAGVDTQTATIRFNSKGVVIAKSKTIGNTGPTGVGGGGVKE